MRLLNALLVIVNLAMFAMLGGFIWTRGYVPGASFNGVELVTTILTALAVLLTALGIFIGGLAIWGYGNLREHARDAATKTAKLEARRVARATAEPIVVRVAGEYFAQVRRPGDTEGDDYGAAASK